MTGGRRWVPVLLAAGLAGCVSPEAGRARGGGPGADPGNHGAVVRMHAGARVYYRTPCKTVKVKCSGPMPAPGT
jgi:hypothetical protein